MEGMQGGQGRVGRLSALVYILISLSAALAFFAGASAAGKYTTVAIYGGTAWVFLLSMIVTMPLVIPWMKKRLRA